MLDFDIPGGGGSTKVFVRRNGCAAPPKEVSLPPCSKVQDLLDKASKVLDIDAPQRAFYSNGVEIVDLEDVEEDEVIFISCGEEYKQAPGTKGGCASGLQVIGNYILHEKLGQGGFGSVIKGVHSETGEMAAVKFVSKRSFKQFSDLQRVYQEIQALRNLRHPNVIGILDVADHPDSICFIMEFAAGGELRGYVERHNFLSEEEARHFFKQISRAVHYIHSKKIIHRDLKLENILLDSKNICKIVDFGLSDYVSSPDKTVTDAGTEAYLAPEVYNGCTRGSDPYKIDVWGLGVILYALAHGKLPFSRPNEETCDMLNAGGLAFKEELSDGYRRIVMAMLTVKVERRATMSEIALDPWVTKNRFADGMTVGFAEDESEYSMRRASGGSCSDLDVLTAVCVPAASRAEDDTAVQEGHRMMPPRDPHAKSTPLIERMREPAQPPKTRAPLSPRVAAGSARSAARMGGMSKASPPMGPRTEPKSGPPARKRSPSGQRGSSRA